MKYLIFLLLLFPISFLGAQPKQDKAAYMEPYKLEVGFNKTTHLVFPSPITSVDRGSQGIVVQKAAGVENILRVKADAKGFEETNLSIITDDGKLYSFVVRYIDSPSCLNVNVAGLANWTDAPRPSATSANRPKLIYTQPLMDGPNLQFYCDKVKFEKNNADIHDISNGVSVSIKGIYIKENTIFLKVDLRNSTNINYDISQFRIYIRDKKQGKRTASQEVEIEPLLNTSGTMAIRARSRDVWVLALPKFTIPDGKVVAVQVMEMDGGRHLSLKLKNKKIIKARTI